MRSKMIAREGLRAMPARTGRRVAAVLIGWLTVALSADAAWAGGDWNDGKIAWQSFEKGVASAKALKRPICLVFYTDWCPHCTTYSKVFHDPRVVERSKKLVMIRVDKDKNPELSKRHAPDGEYIPRTYFLSREGKLDPTIHAPREKFKYFYDEASPAGILAGMAEALEKLQ